MYNACVRVCIKVDVLSLHSLHAVCSVEWLVLDEADKLFEDGPNNTGFREQVSFPYASFAATPVKCCACRLAMLSICLIINAAI